MWFVHHYTGAFGIHDHAYYWPQFTAIPAPVQYDPSDVAIFTLSKLTGHAGTVSLHSSVYQS